MSVGAHFSVNITMGSHGIKGHKYKFTWQTQAVMLSSISFIPVLFSSPEGTFEQMAAFALELSSMHEMITA